MNRRCNWLGLFLAGSLPVTAQGLQSPADPLNLIRELLGTNATFTATAEITGFSTNASDDFIITADYAMLAGQLRTALHQPASSADCDSTGLITIKLPELKRAYVIYPDRRAYLETVLTWREHRKEIATITKTKIRDTTLANQPCVQSRLQITNKLGAQFDAQVWEAVELDHFPVQIQFATPATVFTIRFRHINRTPPAIELFQPPDDYDRYTDPRALSRR